MMRVCAWFRTEWICTRCTPALRRDDQPKNHRRIIAHVGAISTKRLNASLYCRRRCLGLKMGSSTKKDSSHHFICMQRSELSALGHSRVGFRLINRTLGTAVYRRLNEFLL